MTWEQKLEACKALGGAFSCELSMREPGNWYVGASHVEVHSGGCLQGRYGNGPTPEEAVLDHWQKMTELGPNEYLVIDAMQATRRAFRWNGYMWASVKEDIAPLSP